ncbi:MAG: thiolase domain-containing protein [Candidatus Bathyarchaeia archaeon]|nr:thiolase domain-containing protein [Candidatus Bathyarchaeota archaeon]
MAEPLATIVSTGISYFGRRDGVYARELFREAAEEAFNNCPNLDPGRDLKAIFVGQMSDLFEHQGHVGAMISDWLALSEIPALRTEAACASSGAALRCGIMAVASRLCDVVLVGGVEKMTHIPTPKAVEALATAADYPMEQWNGVTFPGLYALMATAHMNRYGTTEEQLAMIAVKNHRNGAKNPKAHLRKEVALDDVLNSRMVAWPLKLYDCSLITDGASCAILTRPELARKYTDTPIHITASAQSHDTLNLADREELTTLKAARKAARQAYEMAKIRPGDVDVAEVHDCFTIAELMAYEDLGFCKPGLGGKLIQEGVTEIGGGIPVNPSGGLKSKGHPVGATGVAQVHEIFLQLRGEAGQRQVAGAEIGLTHNVGGSGATAIIHILRRGD